MTPTTSATTRRRKKSTSDLERAESRSSIRRTAHKPAQSNFQRIYAICGAGKIDIIEQTDPNTYKTFAKIDTAEGARTGFFAPERDTLFVAVPHHGPQQAEVRAYQVE